MGEGLCSDTNKLIEDLLNRVKELEEIIEVNKCHGCMSLVAEHERYDPKTRKNVYVCRNCTLDYDMPM